MNNLRLSYARAEKDICVTGNGEVKKHVATLEEENKLLKARIKELEQSQSIVASGNANNSSRIENLEKMIKELVDKQTTK